MNRFYQLSIVEMNCLVHKRLQKNQLKSTISIHYLRINSSFSSSALSLSISGFTPRSQLSSNPNNLTLHLLGRLITGSIELGTDSLKIKTNKLAHYYFFFKKKINCKYYFWKKRDPDLNNTIQFRLKKKIVTQKMFQL